MITRRRFLEGLGATALAGAAASPLIWHEIETHRLRQRPVRVALGLQKPLRIAALGDIHFDPLCEEGYIAFIAQLLTALNADLIVYTGDFVTHRADRMHDLAAILSRAKSRLGSFATLGNHDHWASAPVVTRELEKKGIRVLLNSWLQLPDEDEIYLTALDSFWAGKPEPTILTKTPLRSRHILLVHEPDPFAQLADPRIRLQISGHTHGGQVRLPVVGALMLPKMGRVFQQGLYSREGRQLFVNPGVGTLFPHVRIHCPPEITIFEVT